MGWFIAQSLVFILVAFAIGLLVGWLIWGRRSKRSTEVVETSASAAESTAVERAVERAVEKTEGDVVARQPEVAEASAAADVAVSEPVEALEAEPGAEAATAAAVESDAVPVAAAEVESEVEAEVEAAPEPAAAVEPEPVVEPEPDNLQRIEGIGPKIERALQAAGLTTWASLAAASEETLHTTLKEQGIRFAPAVHSFAKQAQYLVDGDEAGLEEFQDYLIGGQDRRVKFVDKVDYTDVDEIEGEKAKAEALAADAAEVAAVEAEAEAARSGAKA